MNTNDIIIGEYYRRLTEPEDNYCIPQNELCLVANIDGTEVVVCCGEGKWTWDLAEFADNFVHNESGRHFRQCEIEDLMDSIHQSHVSQSDFAKQLASFTPSLTASGEISDETGIILAGEQNAASVRTALQSVRNKVSRVRADIERKTERMTALLQEQENALTEKMDHMKGIMETMSEAIWTISLYLGREEEIRQLSEGKPAPADEKIVIRQRVLYMDEECGLDPLEGGIDHQSIEKFDEWLVADLSRRDMIIPEQRGIVALKPRREKKYRDGMDPWVAAEMDKADKKTYFLIRNGERLYRIHTELGVDETTIPKRDEFLGMFVRDRYNWEKREHEEEIIRPGDQDYMKIMKQVSRRERDYMRVVLFIQGLLDRTEIFHPLSNSRINILDAQRHGDYIQFLYDAEMGLPSGRKSFAEWLTEINSFLGIGMRIIARFDSYNCPIYAGQYDNIGRIKPKNYGERPSSMQLHTIEKAAGSRFFFYFDRGEIWDTHGLRQAERRASCWVERRDDFILNFDAASIEDMELYLTSRENRQSYMNMLPLMQAAIELKKAEKKEEAPFRQLLIGEVMKTHNVSQEGAEDKIDELISWWKFKNRTHRALTSDDAKALRMIVREFAHKKKREESKDELDEIGKKVIQKAREGRQNVIYIGHVKDRDFVVLVAANEQNTFVHEETWRYYARTGEINHVGTKEWKVVTKRRIRWGGIYESERFASWDCDVKRTSVLSNPELISVIEDLICCHDFESNFEAEYKERVRGYYTHDNEKDECCYPLCANVARGEDGDKVTLYVWDIIFHVDENRPWSSDFREGCIAKISIALKHSKAGEVRVVRSRRWGQYNRISALEKPWGDEGWTGKQRTFWRNDKNIARYLVEEARYERANAKYGKILTVVEDLADQVRDVLYQKAVDAIHSHFVEEYGTDAEDLFEGYLKRREDLPDRCSWAFNPSQFTDACGILIERDEPVYGRTVKDIVDRSKLHGFEWQTESGSVRFGERKEEPTEGWDGSKMPWDLVITEPKKGNNSEEIIIENSQPALHPPVG